MFLHAHPSHCRPRMKNTTLLSLLFLATGWLVSACGGGGASQVTTPAVVLPASYWKMDSYVYPNGFQSETQSSTIGSLPSTVVTIRSTAVLGVADGNGAYSGSTLRFTFGGTSAGDYNVVPDEAAFIASNPADHPMLVSGLIGQATSTGTSQYTATAGQVRVSVDGAGKYHFQRLSPLTMSKTENTGGGVADSPLIMALDIKDVY